LYDTADWQKLRAMHLHEHPMCSVPGCRRRATVVDHVTAHRGEAILFYDPANLQSLCKPHHDSKTVRVDGGFGRTRGTTSTR
jgi:5-methylcytosine-specific restriction endonuclease McrA